MPSPGAGSNSSELRGPGRFDFQEIYDEFHPKICRYLRRLVGTSEAPDLTQEVFAKVSRALPHFRGDSNVSTWVYRIATNTAFDRLRSPSFQRAGQVSLESQKPRVEKSTGYTAIGVSYSMYGMYLQLGAIQAVCIYCLISAVMTVLLLIAASRHFKATCPPALVTRPPRNRTPLLARS